MYYLISLSYQPCVIGDVFTPILWFRKLRLEEVNVYTFTKLLVPAVTLSPCSVHILTQIFKFYLHLFYAEFTPRP